MSTFTPYNSDLHQSTVNNDLEPPADGTHTGCELVDAGAFTSKAGDDYAKFQWRTKDGHTWTVLQGFKSEGQTSVTWSEVSKFGVNPVDITDLEHLNTVLKEHVGSYYDIAVKTNGQFRNTYINGPTTGNNPVVQQQTGLAEPAAVGAGQDDTDDIPF